jgi:hypothetical protein
MDKIRFSLRSPKRVTITVPYSLFVALNARAQEEGRSVSNLCSTLLQISFLPTAQH